MRKGSGFIPGSPGKAQHSFAKVPVIGVDRSLFDRSTTYKTTFDEGWLIPFLCDEVLPGDTFALRLTAFLRISTMKFPIMDNLYFETQFWFVPNRLLQDNWIKLQGEQDNPTDSTDFTVPQITTPVGGFAPLSIYDYMGIRPSVQLVNPINAFHLRAYNFIYNMEYRDQNLQNSLYFTRSDGPDLASNYALVRRGKRHDYFTSCLPWPQKVNDGSALNVPLSGSAPVINDGTNTTKWKGATSGAVVHTTLSTSTGLSYNVDSGTVTHGENAWLNSPSGMIADLSQASGITVNQLRQSVQIQRLFEKDARGGTRYPEIIKSHFGVTSPDFRLQRPELLGRGHSPFNVHPVPQTSGTDSTPQANLASYGTCSVRGHGFTKSFTEHGVILGIMSVRADLNYQQGIHRMWFRQTRYDFAMPVLAHLGEQAVLNQELCVQGTSADSQVFGYQERYAEYRYKPALVTAEFRSDYTATLDAWHLAQDFGSLPTLGSAFIQENAPMERILANDEVPHFLMDAFMDYKCVRPLPVFSVPGWMDHF